jgi:U3 small nucleolar RNA-associated protein MPP10
VCCISTNINQVSARDRPSESLLEQDVFFEHATKAPPVITEEDTISLEAVIKKRIDEESWDDVIRKVEAEAKEFTPKAALNHEKSKLSLAEVYEKQVGYSLMCCYQ